GDGERRLVVGADHADQAAVAQDDQVLVLGVELIDQNAGAGVRVLRDLADERLVVEAVDLLELLPRFRTLEDVVTDFQHPGPPPTGLRRERPRDRLGAGSPGARMGAAAHTPCPRLRGYKPSGPNARTWLSEIGRERRG